TDSNTLWKLMQASYMALNKTNPNITEHCWLRYDIKPRFYEAIGVDAKAKRVNGTNPVQCYWKRGKEQQEGMTLGQVTGKGTWIC
ncbi:ENV2 protein, partial [Edolisoma coerulescens]|nr:ENV2 protein [Edolisoma coerulescens]